MTRKERLEKAGREIDELLRPEWAREMKHALQRFDEIYLSSLERFEAERKRLATIAKHGKRFLAEVRQCSIRQLGELKIEQLQNFLDEVDGLGRIFPPRGSSQNQKQRELARHVFRALLKVGAASREGTLFRYGPYFSVLKIAFKAYGYEVSDRALRRHAQLVREEFKRPGSKTLMTPQRFTVYREIFFDCRPVKKDFESTTMILEAWEAKNNEHRPGAAPHD